MSKKRSKKLIKRFRKLSKTKKIAVIAAVALLLILLGITVAVSANKKTTKKTPEELTQNTEESKAEQFFTDQTAQNDAVPPVVAEEPEKKIAQTPPASKWPVQLTAEQAGSLTVVVNKKYKLPTSYAPALTAVSGGQLRPEAAAALQSLLEAASATGAPMSVLSSYRSYSTQAATYNKWVNQDGRAAADRYSARPGHSEHQTGLAADLGNGICNLEICFGGTAAGQWLSANAQNYGFIIRYPDGKESLTGYQYEPWHIRYVGVEAAKAITASGVIMDQYYGFEAGGYE